MMNFMDEFYSLVWIHIRSDWICSSWFLESDGSRLEETLDVILAGLSPRIWSPQARLQNVERV
ncbi:MAG: hypothetical protein ACI8X5_003677 [Planctomycetota bacterium]|jgi:hypothetical protein